MIGINTAIFTQTGKFVAFLKTALAKHDQVPFRKVVLTIRCFYQMLFFVYIHSYTYLSIYTL
jgi:hypothetical protein